MLSMRRARAARAFRRSPSKTTSSPASRDHRRRRVLARRTRTAAYTTLPWREGIHNMKHATKPSSNGSRPEALSLELKITDCDTIASIMKYPDGPERHDFACLALRFGCLLMRTVSGEYDAHRVRDEC